MSINIPDNFFRETLIRAVTLTTGANFYLSNVPNAAEGYLAISPASSNLREIVYFSAKGSDGNGSFVTVTTANRGLGGTTAQTHAIGEPVRMNVSAETIQEISDALDQIVAGGAQDSSTTTKGIVKLSAAPTSATQPIAVGVNDVRLPTADPTTLFVSKTVSAPVIRTYSTTGRVGSSTTRFDITNTSGTTFRYTYDGTGTDPTINATTFPVGIFVNINSGNFTAANNGLFTVTASGANYFEVTNASGVAENDKTLGTANSYLVAGTKWTKPASLSYIVVEMVGGGGGASTTTASTYNGTTSYFKSSSLSATTGSNASETAGGVGGDGNGGDINITGAKGNNINYDSNGGSSFGHGSNGGLSFLGTKGKGGDVSYTGNSTIGSAGGAGGYVKKIYAAADLSSTEPLVIGTFGVAAGTSANNGEGGFGIITEYYS